MNYNETLEYIHSTPKFNRILGNNRLRELLNMIDNPHKKLKYIHIAGTNGKGSTASMLSYILTKQGYKVGLFTSPFIEIFNERIRINNKYIKNNDLAEIVTEIKLYIDTMEDSPSEFAITTAAAFLYFHRQNCDYVILETGLGGRLDATNVIDESLVTVITSISLDHTQYLGNTIEEITAEKCGIIKNNAQVICYPNQNPTALDVIKSDCKNKNANLIIPDCPQLIDNTKFVYKSKEYQLALHGSYQPYNATMVLETVFSLQNKGVEISENSIKYGLANAKWMARFEILQDNPLIILDGAHNESGIIELKKSLLLYKKRIILVMAMMSDKNYLSCVKLIAPIADIFISTQIDMPRCLTASELSDLAKPFTNAVFTECNPINAYNLALKMANEQDIICICGSLYLVGEIRKNIKLTKENL